MKKLSLIDRAFLLRKLKPFKTLNLDVLLPIADKLVTAPFDKGNEVFRVGDEAHRMYLVVNGKVQLRSPQGVTRTVTENDYFGEEALFSEGKRAYEAHSVTDTLLFSLSRTNLLSIIAECPAVALGFLGVYSAMLPDRSCRE